MYAKENRHLNVRKCLLDYGAPTGNRTPNLLIKSQLLCQLSYRRVFYARWKCKEAIMSCQAS